MTWIVPDSLTWITTNWRSAEDNTITEDSEKAGWCFLSVICKWRTSQRWSMSTLTELYIPKLKLFTEGFLIPCLILAYLDLITYFMIVNCEIMWLSILLLLYRLDLLLNDIVVWNWRNIVLCLNILTSGIDCHLINTYLTFLQYSRQKRIFFDMNNPKFTTYFSFLILM